MSNDKPNGDAMLENVLRHDAVQNGHMTKEEVSQGLMPHEVARHRLNQQDDDLEPIPDTLPALLAEYHAAKHAPDMPGPDCYIKAAEWAHGGTGSGRVLASLLLSLYNSSDYPMTRMYGLHGTLDPNLQTLALDCIRRYTYYGENDRELLIVAEPLAKRYISMHRRNQDKDWDDPDFYDPWKDERK